MTSCTANQIYYYLEITMYKDCYFSAKTNSIITFPHPHIAGATMYGETEDEIKKEYPDMVLMPYLQAIEEMGKPFIEPVSETSQEIYDEMMCILPPENWKQIPGGSFFQMMEYITGDITRYYAYCNGKFYTFIDKAWMTQWQVMQLLKAFTEASNGYQI